MNDPHALISKHFYGTLTDAEASALNAWIRQDTANARLFVREAIVHNTLRTEWHGREVCRQFLESEQEPTATSQAIDSLAPSPRTSLVTPARSFRSWNTSNRVVTAVVACLIACIIWSVLPVKNQALPLASATSKVQLREAIAAAWDPAHEAPPLGPMSLEARNLTSGTISLAFSNGAEAIIQGPARFQPISSTQLQVTSGKVVISCPTPESRGFELILPGIQITDLGTEFGVIAGADNAELHVFEGSVAVRRQAASQSNPTIYRQQQACRLDYSNGPPHPILVDDSAFIRPIDFRLLGTRGPWAEYAQTLRRDRTLVLWSDMTPGPAGQLINAAPVLNNGTRIISPKTALQTQAGRHRGATALQILDAKHAVQMQIPGSFQNLTLAAWVKFFPEPRNARDHRGILMSDGWGLPGQIHWQRKSRDFRLTFPRIDATDHARYVAETKQLDDQQWHLLVTVIDGQHQRRVVQYLDGRALSNESLNIPFRSMQLGNCTLGGWQPPAGNRENRSLNGLIDELFVWNRALDASEVESLYRVSR